MPKNKIIITLGAFIALLPILGFPTSWESFFEVIVGLAIILTSVWATIDKKLIQKAKAQKRQAQREAFEAPETPSELQEPTDSFEVKDLNN